MLQKLTWYSPLPNDTRVLESLDLRLDGKHYFYYLNSTSLDESIIVEEIYKVKAGPIVRNLYTEWNAVDGFKWLTKEPYIWERRKNLGGITLKTVIGFSSPMSTFDYVDGTVINPKGKI